MKNLFFCILMMAASASYGQYKDSMINPHEIIVPGEEFKGNVIQSKYKYEEPEYYLKKAGAIGLNKDRFTGVAIAVIALMARNPDVYLKDTLIAAGVASGISYFFDIAIHSNINKAGLALEERKKDAP